MLRSFALAPLPLNISLAAGLDGLLHARTDLRLQALHELTLLYLGYRRQRGGLDCCQASGPGNPQRWQSFSGPQGGDKPWPKPQTGDALTLDHHPRAGAFPCWPSCVELELSLAR